MTFTMDLSYFRMATLFSFLLFVLFCYILGCLSTGYYYVLLFSKADIRNSGSKSTGATNVGRILGKKGFSITLVIDILKGVLIAVLSRYFNFDADHALLCIIALACGHIWPVQLKFHGGKGIAVVLGFLGIWNFYMLLVVAFVGLVVFLFIRKFTISGLAGMLTIPFYGLIIHSDFKIIFLLLLLTGIIFIAHFENLKLFFTPKIN
jgi:acyl phosphate:glycerol-3-phosphate acyltransferase